MSVPLPHARLAEYVSGELDAAELRAVEKHLAWCAECRDEVRLARFGRAVAVRAGAEPEALPEGLHDRLMAGRGSGASPASPVLVSRRSRVLLAAAAALIALGGIGSAVLREPTPKPDVVAAQDNSVIDAAMAAFEERAVPSDAAPVRPTPDLSSLGLVASQAGAGSLGTQAVSAYSYATKEDRERVVVYLSDRPFTSPALANAQYIPVPMHGRWVTWIPGREPKLIVGTDKKLVHDVCELLL